MGFNPAEDQRTCQGKAWGGRGEDRAGGSLQAGRPDLASPQTWMSAFWETSVCSGAVRTCLECSAASVMRVLSWTAVVATAQVWGQQGGGRGDAGVGLGGAQFAFSLPPGFFSHALSRGGPCLID